MKLYTLRGTIYTIPRDRGKPTILEPYPYSNTGKKEDEILMTSLVVLIHSKAGTFVGGIDIDLSFMTAFVEAAKPYKQSGSSLISQGGVYIAHYDSTMVGKNISEEAGKADFAKAITESRAYSSDTMSETSKDKAFCSVTPI